MDDDQDVSGFGGLAWYQIGRWSAEMDQEHQRTFDHVSGRGIVSRAEYSLAVQMNEALATENLRLIDLISSLENQLAEYRHNYDRLSQWGDEVATELNERRARDAERGQ